MVKMVPFSVMSEGGEGEVRGDEVYKAIYVAKDAVLATALLRDGCAATYCNWSGWTSMHLCAWMGAGEDNRWVDVATELVAHGADIDAVDDRCSTALHWACNEGRETFALHLIEAGANVHIASEHGWTPLHEAAYKGMASVVRRLLVAGADVHSISRRDLSASTIAKEFGHTALADELAALEAERAPLPPVAKEKVAAAASAASAASVERAKALASGSSGGALGAAVVAAGGAKRRSSEADDERRWRLILAALLVCTALALVRIG